MPFPPRQPGILRKPHADNPVRAAARRNCVFSLLQPDHDRVGLWTGPRDLRGWPCYDTAQHREFYGPTLLANALAIAGGACLALSTIPLSGARAQTPDYEAIVAAPDRTDGDRQADARRKPAKLLAFTGVKTGMKVLDMEASAGYSTELLARAVGPSGTVYAQDFAAVIERFVKDKFDIRAKKPVMKNVVHVVRDFDDPIPPDVSGLDLITFFFAYHDITYMPVDRAVMNSKMFSALKPGGYLVIADHSAKPGEGITVARTLHRIEESDAAPGNRGGRLQAGGGGGFPAQSR